MARQRWAVVTGVLLGLLVLAAVNWPTKTRVHKAIEKLGGRVTVDLDRPDMPIIAMHSLIIEPMS